MSGIANSKLELQRASAGSGKTFTLAKKFIWYFITIVDEDGRIRLRTRPELNDSLRHILAVTFTNKATNEMRQRIIKRLDSLANPGDKTLPGYKAPDYLEEFSRNLGVAEEEVSKTCREALRVLLGNYSDFNVATIDSFFQRVLHTLAYETDSGNSFRVELDSDYLSQVGVDATLDEVDKDLASEAAFWVQLIMDGKESKSWNIFLKKISTFSRSESPYQYLINSMNKLESEDYKAIRHEMEEYFSAGTDSKVDFAALYGEMTSVMEQPIKDAFKALTDFASGYRAAMPPVMLEQKSTTNLGKIAAAADKIVGARFDLPLKDKKSEEIIEACPQKLLSGPTVEKFFSKNPGVEEKVRELADRLNSLYASWRELRLSPESREWFLYKKALPFLGLMMTISRKREEYLQKQNAVELGETAMILSKFVTADDAPFIYERLGSRLNHFLIDEFQDTSKLQWQLMSPLLEESLGSGLGNDSLIIGDAKQSIYRFRNADPSLITTEVPARIRSVEFHGDSPAENTNWRSDRRIVKFNNSFFHYLAGVLTDGFPGSDEHPEEGRMNFRTIYSNVIQYLKTLRKKDLPEVNKGYVGVRFTRASSRRSGGPDHSSKTVIPKEVSELVASLLKRGYAMRDIAVLVDTNKQGSAIIDSFIDYNRRLAARVETQPDSEATPIRFVSEQSLLVGEAPAVHSILAVLEGIARGSDPDMERRNWNDMACSYRFYAREHAGEDRAQILRGFFESGGDKNEKAALNAMMSEMQSLALPALVEAAVERFVSDAERERDAIFIAAFQDIVLEYCETHPTDVASFLAWWKRKSKSAAISSPEGVDAVRVMTIHKSKGLEFGCVIVPFADWDMSDHSDGKEWRWVKPSPRLASKSFSQPLPPYLPVAVSDELVDTDEEYLLTEYYDARKLDDLNKAYVAFTRATHELYIFSELPAPTKKKKEEGRYAGPGKMSELLKEFLDSGCASVTGSGEGSAAADVSRSRLLGSYLISPCDENPYSQEAADTAEAVEADGAADCEPDCYSIGAALERVNLPAKIENRGKDVLTLEEYRAERVPESIHFREESLPDVVDAGEDYEERDERDDDPRSYGNLRHAVFENVRVASNLHRAVRLLTLKGLVSDAEEKSIEAELREAIDSVADRNWFAPDLARVFNERPLLKRDETDRRPDRVAVFPDGHAEVIDYKFGKIPGDNRHINQVRRYMWGLVETRKFSRVRGFVWYVREKKIVEVSLRREERPGKGNNR